MRHALRWVALALAGLVLAAGVSVAANRLSRQHVALGAEPTSAGEGLVPAARRSDRPPRHRRARPNRPARVSTSSGTPSASPTGPTSSSDAAAPVGGALTLQPAPAAAPTNSPAPALPAAGTTTPSDEGGGRAAGRSGGGDD